MILSEIDPARREQASAALHRYELLAPAQVARLEEIVNLFDQEVTDDIRRLAVLQAALLGISLLLGVLVLFMARRLVALPLRRLIESTRAIAAGAYDQDVQIASRDEIGDLAETFNRMADAIDEKTTRLKVLNRTAVAISSSPNLQEKLNDIMRYGASLTGSKAACIAFYDPEDKQFKEWVTHGLSDDFVKNMSFRPRGLAEEVFADTPANARNFILSNDRPEAGHPLSQAMRDEGIRALICLPLTSHASRLGVIYFYRADRDTYTPDEIDLLQTFSNLAAGAIEEAKLREHLAGLARTDALTGLANRREFDARLVEEHTRAQRYGKTYSFMMLDIDFFKQVNDTYGHAAGDAVLKELADIIRRELRDGDIPARYGGEEFAMILPEISGVGAMQVAERMRRAVAATRFVLPDGREIGITVSIGVSCYPSCAASPEVAVSTADQALYMAKKTGRNRVMLYRETLKARIDKDPNLIVTLLRESSENILPVVNAVTAKAPFLHPHTDSVLHVVTLLAQALGLTAEERDTLRLAAELHDIGMATIPDALLAKTTELTAEEWGIIKQHPVTGAACLEQVPNLRHLAPLVRHHHERYDGTGYPDGLKGEALPKLARVLAVADAYGSMISDWPGHTAVSPALAREKLKAGAGTQFDPGMVEALLRALDNDTS